MKRRSRNAPMSGTLHAHAARGIGGSRRSAPRRGREQLVSGRSASRRALRGRCTSRLRVRQADVVSSTASLGDEAAEGMAEQVRRVGRASRASDARPPRTRRACSRRRPPPGVSNCPRWSYAVASKPTDASNGSSGVKSSLLPVQPGISRTCATASRYADDVRANVPTAGLDGGGLDAVGQRPASVGVLIDRAAPCRATSGVGCIAGDRTPGPCSARTGWTRPCRARGP